MVEVKQSENYVSEKRRFARVVNDVPVELENSCPPLPSKVIARDISESGCGLCIDIKQQEQQLLRGLLFKKIDLSLKIDLSSEFGTVEVAAQIVWIKEKDTVNPKSRLGVKFTEVSGQDQDKIKSYIHRQLDKTNLPKIKKTVESTAVYPKKITKSDPSYIPVDSNANKFFGARRREGRIGIKEGEMFIKIRVNFGGRHELISQIIDINSYGLSFKLKGQKTGLLPGTPFKNIVISNDKHQKIIRKSNIIYCNPIEDGNPDEFRVGLKFDTSPSERSVIRRKLLGSYDIRMYRYGNELFASLKWKITFTYKQKNMVSDKLINLSKFGIAFCIEQVPPVFKNSDVLYDFKAQINDELVYEGECIIVGLENSTAGLVIRCSLRNGRIDLAKIFILSRRKQTAEEIENFLPEFSKFEDVEPEFKADVADLQYFLEKIEDRLNIEDQKIESANIKEEYISYYSEKLLDSILKPISERLDKFFDKLRILVSNFDQSRYDLYKYYFQEHLKQFFLKSPFINRSYNKPLGYAGDYEVINMIYGDPCIGENLLAKLINKYAWQQIAAKAVRNRIPYMTTKFNGLLNSSLSKDKNHFKVMSVACGSAVEIQEMIRHNKHADRFIFTLIDADSEALLYSQDKLLSLIKERGCNVNINFINKAVDQLTKDKDLVNRFGKQDIIYSLGLFDYLTLRVAKKVVKCLYELLSSNGKLIIGNFGPLNDTKVYMEYVHDWYLLHRSEEEMLKFVEEIDRTKNVFFETESTKATNFLVVEK